MKIRYSYTVLICLVICFVCPFMAYLANSKNTRFPKTIALLTDYGEKDFYAGAVKGSILSIAPEANIIDITHQIKSFNIQEGALTLLLSAREFPKGTVFVAIVDPGVGTNRRAILLTTKNDLYFIGPDNGLFSYVMDEFGIKDVYEISNRKWYRKGKISRTFHGRDIFGPAAAHLVNGRSPKLAGPVIYDFLRLPVQKAILQDKKITGQVILIDSYGNFQLNIPSDLIGNAHWQKGDTLKIRIGQDEEIINYLQTYGDVPAGKTLALLASTDFLEIAINLGNAAEKYHVQWGDPVIIEKIDSNNR